MASVNYKFGEIVAGALKYAPNPLRKDGVVRYNAPDEYYLAAGYLPVVKSAEEVEEYKVEEKDGKIYVYDNVVTVEMVRQQKLSENSSYCASPSVKHFVYNGMELWIDQMERLSLQNIAESYHSQGIDTFISSYWGIKFPFSYQLVSYICSALWIYDNECNNVEDDHRVAINALTTKEALRAYDVTVGYPSNPVFMPNSED